MGKAISIILLVVGTLFIAFGFGALDSFSSDVSRFFTGSPSDKTIWFLILGTICSVLGLVGISRKSREAKD